MHPRLQRSSNARAIALLMAVAISGCAIKPGGIIWIGRDPVTYVVATASGQRTVTCEWFSHDTSPYWEPTTEDTYEFQWVCDAIPLYWGGGDAPRTIANPSASWVASQELARRQ